MKTKLINYTINLLWGLLSFLENIIPVMVITMGILGCIKVNEYEGYLACFVFLFSINLCFDGIILMSMVGEKYKKNYRRIHNRQDINTEKKEMKE